MKNILFWLVPPVVGAIIGYVTNAVAIKMLFRPLKEIRIAGFRLPFTPGILPRQRHKLADSIGRMVERELLTPGVIRERLARKDVHEKIENALGSYTTQTLDEPLSNYVRPESDTSSGISGHVGEILKDFVGSEVFNSFLEFMLRNWISNKADSSDEDEKKLGTWLKSRIRDFGSVFIQPAHKLIKNGINRELSRSSRGDTSVYQLALENIIEKYPGITLGEFLSLAGPKKKKLDLFLAEKTTDTLDDNIEGALATVNVKTLVSDRINSLDMLRVEKIVLDVMADQLQWINVFGGILGALIGFLEVLFVYFSG